jgi:hypothetical protein
VLQTKDAHIVGYYVPALCARTQEGLRDRDGAERQNYPYGICTSMGLHHRGDEKGRDRRELRASGRGKAKGRAGCDERTSAACSEVGRVQIQRERGKEENASPTS